MGHRYYYCHDCRKLHRFYQTWRLSSEGLLDQRGRLDNTPGHCYARNKAYLWEMSIHLPYRFVRLVMNRHILGPASGLPLSVLDIPFHYVGFQWTRAQPVRWEVKWTARIIGGELYLHGEHRFAYVPGTDLETLRVGLDFKEHAICTHLKTHDVCPVTWTMARVSPLHKRTESDAFVSCEDVVGACRRCLTDYDLSISLLPRGSGEKSLGRCDLRIEVHSYHQLGDGRSPKDWKWVGYIGRRSRYARTGTFSSGAVRERWIKSNPS